MEFNAWLTLAVLGVTFIAIILEVAAYEAVMFGAVTVLMLFGVIEPVETLRAFGSPAVITVGALFVVAAAVRRTGMLNSVADRLFGRTSRRDPLLMLTVPSAFFSGFLNNTPIVAMFAPTVIDWCKRSGRAPSKLLMPLSFATMLGGMCTLIGTSTTLIVDGLMRAHQIPGLGMFEIAWVGVPAALVGIALLVVLSPRLLPDRHDPMQELGRSRREYLVEMMVGEGSPLAGETIVKAGLRNLNGLYLLNIERDDVFIGPVRPDERLQVNDRLVFTGAAGSIVDLRNFPGLSAAHGAHYDPTGGLGGRVYEVVVSTASPLVGHTIKAFGFRGYYDAAVIAVHRAGHRLSGKIGAIEIRAGDTLMLETLAHFDHRWGDRPDFALISHLTGDGPPVTHGIPYTLAVLGGFVALVALDILPLVVGALTAVGALLMGRVISTKDARSAVDLGILTMIACAIGLGLALESSGLAAVLSDGLLRLTQGLGPLTVLAAVFICASVLTSLISNAAAAAILFPIVAQVAEQGGYAPRPFIIVLAIASSAAFMTPTGYQTNLMVYGPGGYRFADFVRLGLPLQLAVLVVTLVVVPIVWPLQ